MTTPTITRVQIPNGIANYTYGAQEDLAPEDIADALRLFPDMTHAWYWYANGGYEGTGYFLALSQHSEYRKTWAIVCLDHCSCYGPFDSGSTYYWKTEGSGLENLKNNGTEEWWRPVEPLVNAAKENGHE